MSNKIINDAAYANTIHGKRGRVLARNAACKSCDTLAYPYIQDEIQCVASATRNKPA